MAGAGSTLFLVLMLGDDRAFLVPRRAKKKAALPGGLLKNLKKISSLFGCGDRI
jgi:hypothetical protein